MSYFSSKFTVVKKRDGRVVPFEQSRITAAILKAMNSVQEGGEKDAEYVSNKVIKQLKKTYETDQPIGIEQIQDEVEKQLILTDYANTAKGYILYRRERAKLRERKKEIPKDVEKKVFESKKYFKNPLAEFIYYRSYSRWIDSENRRESWIESVDRYMSFMKENLGKKLKVPEY